MLALPLAAMLFSQPAGPPTMLTISQITMIPPAGLPCAVVAPPSPGGPVVCATLGPGVNLVKQGSGWQLTAAGPQWAFDETPAGTVDGTNMNFTLAHPPLPTASLELIRNGLVLSPLNDFVVTGNQVTFARASTPMPGDILIARSYQY